MRHDPERTEPFLIEQRLGTAVLALLQWLVEDCGEVPDAMVPLIFDINNTLGHEQYRQLHQD